MTRLRSRAPCTAADANQDEVVQKENETYIIVTHVDLEDIGKTVSAQMHNMTCIFELPIGQTNCLSLTHPTHSLPYTILAQGARNNHR